MLRRHESNLKILNCQHVVWLGAHAVFQTHPEVFAPELHGNFIMLRQQHCGCFLYTSAIPGILFAATLQHCKKRLSIMRTCNSVTPWKVNMTLSYHGEFMWQYLPIIPQCFYFLRYMLPLLIFADGDRTSYDLLVAIEQSFPSFSNRHEVFVNLLQREMGCFWHKQQQDN